MDRGRESGKVMVSRNVTTPRGTNENTVDFWKSDFPYRLNDPDFFDLASGQCREDFARANSWSFHNSSRMKGSGKCVLGWCVLCLVVKRESCCSVWWKRVFFC